MSNYSLILSEIVPYCEPIQVYELCNNGKSYFKDFAVEMMEDPALSSKFAAVIRTIEAACSLQRLNKRKFREIQGHNLPVKLYEAKSQGAEIRVYLFHEEKKGRIIVLGALKGTQTKDISRVKKIIKDYIDEK